jgi:hypothetical protein
VQRWTGPLCKKIGIHQICDGHHISFVKSAKPKKCTSSKAHVDLLFFLKGST